MSSCDELCRGTTGKREVSDSREPGELLACTPRPELGQKHPLVLAISSTIVPRSEPTPVGERSAESRERFGPPPPTELRILSLEFNRTRKSRRGTEHRWGLALALGKPLSRLIEEAEQRWEAIAGLLGRRRFGSC